MNREPKDHKTESAKRTITYSICREPRCKFNGKYAAQGVCFSRNRPMVTDFCNYLLGQGEELLAEMKKLRRKNGHKSDKDWIAYLEGHLVCDWANQHGTLDELIHLRAENAKLRLKLGKWKG